MLAPDGSCKVFDADANGYVRGEGGGAIVLQRLKDAEKNHRDLKCRIQGVIRSVVLNHNGTSVAYTAPNGASQSELLATAVKQAGIMADDTAFIETHGTGTKLGDPVEWAAINEVYLMNRDPSIRPIIIGAVKSNIGHLEASAGIAGLIKTLFVLKNLLVPPNLHLKTLNPLIVNDLKKAIFPDEMTAISRGHVGVFAALSSFGSGELNLF
jgi:acyl transferase domain-containing protein